MSSTPIRVDDDRVAEIDDLAEQQGVKRATALDLVLAEGLRALTATNKRGGPAVSARAREQFTS